MKIGNVQQQQKRLVSDGSVNFHRFLTGRFLQIPTCPSIEILPNPEVPHRVRSISAAIFKAKALQPLEEARTSDSQGSGRPLGLGW